MRPLPLAVLLAAHAAHLGADEVWVVPAAFRVTPGTTVEVEIRRGARFPEPASRPDPGTLGRFVVITDNGTRTLPLDTLPAAFGARFRARAGTSAVVLEGRAAVAGGEAWTRSAKALVRAGEGASVATRPVGLELELVPRADPYQLSAGEALAVQALLRGRPLAGAALQVTSGGASRAVTAAADGTVSLERGSGGPVAVTAVHREPCRPSPPRPPQAASEPGAPVPAAEPWPAPTCDVAPVHALATSLAFERP